MTTQVMIKDVVDHLSAEMRWALEDAMKVVLPKAQFDRDKLFREFKLALCQRCSVWKILPDELVTLTK